MTFPISDIAARFAQGESYEQYLAHVQKNRETIERMTQTVQLDAPDEKFFGELNNPVNVLVVSEDWCPDCALNVPILMHIARSHPAMRVRFVGRDANLDLLEHAKKDERKAIPTFFFFDAQWNAIGHWVERPMRADTLLSQWDRAHPAPSEPDRTHPSWRAYRQARSAYRDELFFARELWRDTLAELRRILARESISNVASPALG